MRTCGPTLPCTSLAELSRRLDGASELCGDCEEELDEICCYLHGPDQDRLVEVARAAIAGVSLPHGVYAVKTTPGAEASGDGQRVPLWWGTGSAGLRPRTNQGQASR